MPVGQIVGGIMGNKAGKMQAKAIEQATDKSIAFQKDMFNQGKQIQAPWTESGGNALSQMSMLMGFGPNSSMAGGFSNGMWQPYQAPKGAGGTTRSALLGAASGAVGAGGWQPNGSWENYDLMNNGAWSGQPPAGGQPAGAGGTGGATSAAGSQPWATPEGRAAAQQDAFGAFYTSPGYQFRLTEGIAAIDASAAARGRLLSGSQTKAVQRYGEGLAASEFGDYWNRLAGMAGSGQTSAAGTANAAGATGANVGNTIMQGGMGAGAARASGYNALGQGISSGLVAMQEEAKKIGGYFLGGGFLGG